MKRRLHPSLGYLADVFGLGAYVFGLYLAALPFFAPTAFEVSGYEADVLAVKIVYLAVGLCLIAAGMFISIAAWRVALRGPEYDILYAVKRFFIGRRLYAREAMIELPIDLTRYDYRTITRAEILITNHYKDCLDTEIIPETGKVILYAKAREIA